RVRTYTSACALSPGVDGALPIREGRVARGRLPVAGDLRAVEEPDRDLLVRYDPADVVDHDLLGLVVLLEARLRVLLHVRLGHEVIGRRVVDVLHIDRGVGQKL